ncbi:MAG: electron transfer flavoprotein subunit alpha/FixB family protein [Acidobacteriota bacterium]
MSADVLVVMERGGVGFHRMSWEALAAGQKLAAEMGGACSAVVVGKDAGSLAAEVAGKKLGGVWSVQHELLGEYTADGWTAALAGLIAEAKPGFVVLPHTYQVRDFAPKLATRMGEVLISDVTGFVVADGKPVFTRQWMQGKLNASYAHKGEGVCFVSVQAGSFRGDAVEAGDAACEVKTFAPAMEAGAIRTKPSAAFREAAQTVDLSAAPMIVSVGRGIGEQENLGIVEELAAALGAEMAASRPICDAGWMAMERQVGSSGQTVAPKVYLAVGISGAIQHLVGMKGAKMVVAINKDAEAPIFEVADVGVVGDLFEVVPALTKAVLAAKG